MAGIYPDGGVPASNTTNTVDAPTENCSTELFHSTSRCTPRFDPASANAVLSELLNVMVCAGHTYDCSLLTNLCTAIRKMTGANTTIAEGDVIYPGNFVVSSDDIVMWNCTGNDVTLTSNVTAAGLSAQGFCRLDTAATVAAFSGTGVDSFGNAIVNGDPVITFPTGQTLVVNDAGGGGGGTSTPVATIAIDGTVEIAQSTEIADALNTGGSGAEIVMTPGRMANVGFHDTAALPIADGTDGNNSDKVWFKDESANTMRWLPVGHLLQTVDLPTAGNANQWYFSNLTTGNIPNGPTARGYWHVTFTEPSDGANVIPGTLNTNNGRYAGSEGNGRGGIALPGAVVNLSSSGSGESDGFATGWWVALPS